MSIPPVIELQHVTKHFGAFAAVQDAHFSIAPGEFFSMLGPSGCGKTTTLRMIAGFEQPSSGQIRLEGVDVSTTPPYKRNVNTVFQHYALFPHMTVWDNVAFGPRSARLDRAEVARRCNEMLEVVRLGDLAGRRPSQLSGGQQQRVALARALVNYPAALLLDEPLGALDLKLRQVMQLELKRIQREVGITFIYVTHDQEEALTMSDRIAVMNEGRVDQIGTPVEIYDRPATEFVAGFIGQANLWPTRVETVVEGQATVSVLGTTLKASAPDTTRPGPATLMVRPERITVGTDRPDRRVAVQVIVTDLVFQGPVVRLSGVADDGSEVVANLAIEGHAELPRAGESVWASWSAPAGLVLPSATSSAATNVERQRQVAGAS